MKTTHIKKYKVMSTRIKVNIGVEGGVSKGSILVPFRLGKKRSAMIAAAIETVGQVGPCEAEVKVDKIQDAEQAKREYVRRRSGELVGEIEEEKRTLMHRRMVEKGEDHREGGRARTEHLAEVELRSMRRGGKLSLHILVWRRTG